MKFNENQSSPLPIIHNHPHGISYVCAVCGEFLRAGPRESTQLTHPLRGGGLFGFSKLKCPHVGKVLEKPSVELKELGTE